MRSFLSLVRRWNLDIALDLVALACTAYSIAIWHRGWMVIAIVLSSFTLWLNFALAREMK